MTIGTVKVSMGHDSFNSHMFTICATIDPINWSDGKKKKKIFKRNEWKRAKRHRIVCARFVCIDGSVIRTRAQMAVTAAR